MRNSSELKKKFISLLLVGAMLFSTNIFTELGIALDSGLDINSGTQFDGDGSVERRNDKNFNTPVYIEGYTAARNDFFVGAGASNGGRDISDKLDSSKTVIRLKTYVEDKWVDVPEGFDNENLGNNFRVEYDWALFPGETIKDGDYFTLELPIYPNYEYINMMYNNTLVGQVSFEHGDPVVGKVEFNE